MPAACHWTKVSSLCIFLFVNSWFPFGSHGEELTVFVGTEGPHGIYSLTLGEESGEMSECTKVADLEGAGFLASHANVLYSTGRVGNQGCVASFSISKGQDGSAKLKRLSHRILPDNQHPTHISLDRERKHLLSAQYGGGTVAVFEIGYLGQATKLTDFVKHEGGSKVEPSRQDKPHPHWIGTDVQNSIVAVPDLGLDQVVIYSFDAESGKLKLGDPWQVAPGSGPRHMKFHPNMLHAYVLNELSLTVSVFQINSGEPSWTEIQTIDSLPKKLRDRKLNTAAEIRIHPNGKYLYTSNRGHDSITVFEIDPASGKLTVIQRESIRGSWPRNFSISPKGRWLLAAGKNTNSLSLFQIGTGGKLTFTRAVRSVPRPICILFEPTSH